MNLFVQNLADQFFLFITRQMRRRRIGKGDTSHRIHHKQHRRRIIRDRLQKLLLMAQLFFGSFGFSDVDVDAENTG